VAIFGGVLFAFAFNQLFGAPRTLVGWALVVVLSLRVKHWDRHWLAYSVIFWACDLSQEDHFALIAVTTLLFAALTAASVVLPDHKFNGQKHTFLILTRVLTSLPVSCNNLLFHTGLGIVRFALFLILVQTGQNKRNLAGIYILFAKSEALLPLILWHVVVQCAHKRVVLHPSLLEEEYVERETETGTGLPVQERIEVI
jgi:hypothetical protein